MAQPRAGLAQHVAERLGWLGESIMAVKQQFPDSDKTQ